jgi:hypothetical protein
MKALVTTLRFDLLLLFYYLMYGSIFYYYVLLFSTSKNNDTTCLFVEVVDLECIDCVSVEDCRSIKIKECKILVCRCLLERLKVDGSTWHVHSSNTKNSNVRIIPDWHRFKFTSSEMYSKKPKFLETTRDIYIYRYLVHMTGHVSCYLKWEAAMVAAMQIKAWKAPDWPIYWNISYFIWKHLQKLILNWLRSNFWVLFKGRWTFYKNPLP